MPHEPPPGPLARNLLALASMIELRNDAEALAMLCKPAKTEPLPPGRLNSILWERCLAMAFVLRKPSSPCQVTNLNLSGPRGALQ